MSKALLWLLVLFAVAAGMAVAMHYNQGYVLVVLAPWRVELSLNLFVLLMLLAFFGMYFVARLVSRTLGMPAEVTAFRARKRFERGVAALSDATRLHIEGRYGHALKRSEAAYATEVAPGLSALLAARAASRLGDVERERKWLAHARSHDQLTRIARLMTEAELDLHARRFDDAHARLAELRASGQRHIAALRLSLRVAQARGEWEEALRTARQLEKHRAISPEEALPLARRANLELVRKHAGNAQTLARFWGALPEGERDHRVTVATVRALREAGDHATAQGIIEGSLEREWDSELAGLYGECTGGDVVARIARAEAWLKRQPGDARLLLTLGRLCAHKELWGKAQSYFEASLSVEALRETHVALAHLFERLGRESNASQQYRLAAEF